MTTNRSIRLIKVRQNNLKNVTVEFPARKISVVTGLSGSGKSSLVFDTLYAEGQRRYVESLSTYTRQFLEKMPKPDLDGIQNIPPAIALEQKNHVVNSRSTVGTQTEIVDYLRVLFAKVGRTSCMDCGGHVKKLDAQSTARLVGRMAPFAQSHDRRARGRASESDTSATQGKKKKATAKKAKASPSKKTKAAPIGTSPLTLFQVLREQGFKRVLWRRSGKGASAEVLDLEELGTESFPEVKSDAVANGELFVVVDRLRLTGEA